MTSISNRPKLAILGAGGLGREMLRLLDKRPVARVAALVDSSGYLYDEAGLAPGELAAGLSHVAELEGAKAASEPILEMMSRHGADLDGIFMALPNLPNEFIPGLAGRIAAETEFRGVMVDALKRSAAVRELLGMDEKLADNDVLYLAGCGATPGLLTAAAAIAAQSFVEVTEVKITFGVGIANWQGYRATIREDIAHLEGYDVATASSMTESEVDALLEARRGILELVDMEHADDVMLERVGVCPADRVSVGGVVDTRNPRKPLSTNVQLTGITYQGSTSTHTFTLGDETTMAANVNGTALGYLNAGFHLWQQGIRGVRTAAEVMPRFAPVSCLSSTETAPMSRRT